MIEFEYIPIKDSFSHNNRDNDYQILEYRIIVYEGAFYFDDGIIVDEKKFKYYSQNLNSGEVLQHQNINIKALSKPCFAVLIVKKQKIERAVANPRDPLRADLLPK